MRPFLKTAGIIPLLALYILTACACAILPAGARLRRKILARNSSFFSRIILSLFNIRMHLKHRDRMRLGNHGLLIVANHVSYVDVLVIAALMPTVFITSVELGSTLFLGLLARLGGCLFVERRKVAGLKREIAAIARVLAEGSAVALFPEGTTSNGESVQPFKNSLFDSALASRTEILPICLRYTAINVKPITALNRDSVYYHSGASFFQHIPHFLSLRSITVEVIVLTPIRTEGAPSRKELAAAAHAAITAAYHKGQPSS
jgi:1-acyl-sn-glycerol-3-phosphate acyltransferase